MARTKPQAQVENLVDSIVTRVLAQLSKPNTPASTDTTPLRVPATLTVELPPQSGTFRKIKGAQVLKVTPRAQQILDGTLDKGRGLVIVNLNGTERRALVHTGK
jgi:hypothetical protein